MRARSRVVKITRTHLCSPPEFAPSYGDVRWCDNKACSQVFVSVIRKDPRRSHWKRLSWFGKLKRGWL